MRFALALALLIAPAAAAHGGAPHLARFDSWVREGHLELELLVDPRLYLRWTGLQAEDPFALDAKTLKAALAAAPAVIAALEVEIDGVRVRPVVESLEPNEIPHATTMVDYLQLMLRYPTAGAPRRIDLRWVRWEGLPDEQMDSVPASVTGPRTKQEPLLTEKDPGFSWFTADSPRRVLALPAVAPVADPAKHWVDLGRGLMLALCLAAPALWLARAPPRLSRPLLGTLAIVALACTARAVRLSEVPRVPTPTPEQARALTQALTRNVYRAFDYTDEGDVYDALARSVAGPLLDRVYRDVHAALVSREHGAAGRVVDVTFVEHALEGPPGEASFVSISRWRVAGRIVHWGHEHLRTLSTSARVTVRHLGADGWRIVAIELLAQEASEE